MPLPRAMFVAALLATILTVYAGPSTAQLPPIAFPDTAVGSSATIKCPTTTVSLCFGTNCSASGMVQSVSGPGAPFSVNKFNLLSSAEFFAGNCEAHPVNFPVTVGAGQILAYQATFSPTAGGTFNGVATFNTSGGPATVNLTGKGIAGRSDRGGVVLLANTDNLIPGNTLELQYRLTKGTLTGNVDLYIVVALPSGQLLFATSTGNVTPNVTAFRTNVSVTDTPPQPLFSDQLPVNAPYGVYTFYMVMAYAGSDAVDPKNWASAITSAAVTYGALSSAQRAILQSREGNPDLVAMTWIAEQNERRESWIYFSGSPTIYRFLNGALQGQTPAPGVPTGPTPKVDPALFNPQTTLAQLTARFGPPASETGLDGVAGLEVVKYNFGLSVVFRDGILSSASATVP